MKVKLIAFSLLFVMLLFIFISCENKTVKYTDYNVTEKTENPISETSDNGEEVQEPEEVAPETTPSPSGTPTEPEVEENVPVTGISLTLYDLTLFQGEKKMPIVTMYPENATNKGEVWTSSDTSVATVDAYGNILGVSKGVCTVTVTSQDNPAVFAQIKVTVSPDAELTYIDGILIVNKTYALPKTYAPGWETEASGPLWQMIAAAKQDGIELWMTSGYRSWADQNYIYNGYVARDGQEEADTYSARPGHSEHQTGLAYDLNDLPSNFGETLEGIWVAENCHKYGFIIRYPKGKEKITGYIYEPWHIRYLGIEKATEVYESGLCLEEFLGITSCYSDAVNS